MQMADDPPGSRLFIVCGKSIEADVLQAAFRPYGNVQNVKVIREKGVAYVKYDKASSAALAIESLNGAVLNNGRGPKLKVLLAEAPSSSANQNLRLTHPGMPMGIHQGWSLPQPKPLPEQEISSDPDNIPPRSRLFIVVPKQAEPQQIQDDMAGFVDLEYCKTDLIASKGVVFCKFTKASSALSALEDVSMRGTVAGYKVKCMLAEPKTKRGRSDGSPQDMYSPMTQASKLEYMNPMQLDSMPMKLPGLGHQHMGVPDYAAISGLSGLTGGLGGFNGLNANLADMQTLSAQVNLGFGLSTLPATSTPGFSFAVSPHTSPNLSKQRLFVVVHKGVAEDAIARLFRRFPGMEYCDLKKDRATAKSKGYCYINYSTPEAAAAAVEQLNGIEFPVHSGHRIKVMYAEPLGVRNHSGSHSPAISMPTSSPSPVHTPLSRNMTPDVATVQESLAQMSMPRVGSQNGVDDLEAARRMASPTVARELMFNVA